jgi:hypothetical protein
MPGPHITDIKSELLSLDFIMLNVLYILNAFLLSDIYSVSYMYGFFPQIAKQELIMQNDSNHPFGFRSYVRNYFKPFDEIWHFRSIPKYN